MKRCPSCGLDLPLTAFGPSARGAQGRRETCRPCRNGAQRERLHSDPEARLRQKYAQIKYMYNLTREQYDALLEAQSGCCAICRAEQRERLAVDHDHACCVGPRSCGRCVRGLLCQRCNAFLALIEDAELLASASAYLARYAPAWSSDGD